MTLDQSELFVTQLFSFFIKSEFSASQQPMFGLDFFNIVNCNDPTNFPVTSKYVLAP